MAFNLFTTKRVFCFGQYHGINDLITDNLRGDKRAHHQQFLVGEFHYSAVCKRRVSQVDVAWSEDLPTENYKFALQINCHVSCLAALRSTISLPSL
jgi:hypothetical protein